MAGAVDKKIKETREEIEDSPSTFQDGRSSILDDIALAREFAHTRLNGLCKAFPTTNTSGASATNSLAQICEHHAQVRALCIGAKAIKTGFEKFAFPAPETVNGALQLTEPNTSVFGVKTMDITEDNTITLSNTSTATQTIGTNTVSTYVGNYYLCRSRVDGELVDISKNTDPYATPNPDVVFGNAIAWGSSVSGEEDANTWNYHWATANIAGIETFNSGAYNEVTKLTMSQSLTQGSNTNYTPVGPSFGQKYYLKRKADSVNTFTITATTVNNSVEVTSISDADLAKIKYNDVITGTGIPTNSDGTPAKIQAVQPAQKKLRIADITLTTGTVGQSANVITLSGATWPEGIQGKTVTIAGGGGNVVSRESLTEITVDNSASVSSGTGYSLLYAGKATADGTVTVTVNSVPFGHAKDDIFCQIEIVSEGLVKNDNFKPIGDNDGVYSAANEGPDDQLVANTSQFIGLLGFFDPDNGGSPNNDLTRSARQDYSSQGKEVGGTTYPYKETNPMKPATGGTNKAYELESGGGIIGTQPSGFTENELHSGRYVRFDHKRADENGILPEHRYLIDSAAKWFYEFSALKGYAAGTVTVPAVTMPNDDEPRASMPTNGLTDVVTAINGSTSIVIPTSSGVTGITAHLSSGSIPLDSDCRHSSATLSGAATSSDGGSTYAWNNSPPSAGDVYASYYTLVDNLVVKNDQKINVVTLNPSNATGTSQNDAWTANTVAESAVGKTYANCSHNFLQRLVYNNGGSGTSSMNTNSGFIADTVDDLQGLCKFRDGLVATGTAQAGGSGISDTAWDNYILTSNTGGRCEWEISLDAVNSYLTGLRSTLSDQSRSGYNSNVDASGDPAIAYSNTSFANWAANNSQMLVQCNKRVAEIGARIGIPTRAGTPVTTRTQYPAVRVSALPASNTTNGFLPYGRTLYNECNHLLGSDLNLLGNLIKNIQSLGDLVNLVKKARNRYELLSGRDKEYTDV